MPGPAPKPEGARRRTNATVAMTKLPAEGRKGPPPVWPLPTDVVAASKLDRLHEQMDEAELEAQGDDREARNARRRLLSLRERAEGLAAQIAQLAELESVLWADLWALPQAFAWERSKWTREVALYARWQIKAEMGDAEAAKEARFWSDRLGLNPMAMLRLRWEVAGDEIAGQRAARTARAAPAPRKSRFKAIDGKGA